MFHHLRLNSSIPPGINVSEFYDVFYRLWLRAQGTHSGNCTRRVGIAVSGGVDSMALAHLCSSFQRLSSTSAFGRFRFKAFVVDHKSQDGSSEQAERTRGRLHHMGLDPTVIPLKWPAGILPSKLPSFETQARRLRYQALGKACSESNLNCLLLAHHSDDQAETILMRLTAGHTGKSLVAMPKYAGIPECWGIHGVGSSGKYEEAERYLRFSQLKDVNQSHRAREVGLNQFVARPMIFEKGGVSIMRPLLGYDKEQLRRTCEAHSVPWEEDTSNHDPSLTPRNTIRNLFWRARLPRALQKPSLLQLARHKKEEYVKLQSAFRRTFKECEVLLLDVRSGVLIVRLPTTLLLPMGNSTPFLRDLATRLLRGLSDIVSPQEQVLCEGLDSASEIVFPSLDPSSRNEESVEHNLTSFTAGSVQFRRISCPSTNPGKTQLCSVDGSRRSDLGPDFAWVLTRQPFSTPPIPLQIAPMSISQTSNGTHLKPPEAIPDPLNQRKNWSPWYLWDGRYWIRVLNHTTKPLVVRAWQSHEMSGIRSSTPSDTFKAFHDLLKLAAPGKVRWTIPVIAEAAHNPEQDNDINNSSSSDGNKPPPSSPGKILAFPTLGKTGHLDAMDENGNRKVEWEVRYKRVTLPREDEQGKEEALDPSFVTSWYDS